MAEPLPVCYLNGEYLPLAEARISPLDRGFLYSDGVYELMPVYARRPFRFPAHTARLTRSLEGISMNDPHTDGQWRAILGGLIERNNPPDDCYVYWQVTRGAQYGRTHAPLPIIPRTVFAFCAPLPVTAPEVLEKGVSCVTAADTRWARCDIKSVALLANVLLRQHSVEAGAAETILLRDAELTEASASAVHVVLGGEVFMPPNSRRILPGTTRSVVEEMAARAGVHCRVLPVSEAQLRAADEVWISAATRELQAVTSIDGRPVGSGKPGPLWRRVYDELQRYKQQLQGTPW
jgi:D-alanine transaminase